MIPDLKELNLLADIANVDKVIHNNLILIKHQGNYEAWEPHKKTHQAKMLIDAYSQDEWHIDYNPNAPQGDRWRASFKPEIGGFGETFEEAITRTVIITYEWSILHKATFV